MEQELDIIEVPESIKNPVETFLNDFMTNPNQTLIDNGVTQNGLGFLGGSFKYVQIQHVLGSGQKCGRCRTDDTWIGRPLNTLSNPDSLNITLSNNEFTLNDLGMYYVSVRAGKRRESYHLVHRLCGVSGQNITLLSMTTGREIEGFFHLTQPTTFELQYLTNVGYNNQACLGEAASSSGSSSGGNAVVMNSICCNINMFYKETA